MRERWRRFVQMPDRERARLLALISAGVIISLLYLLGAMSLYLRARYLQPETPPSHAAPLPAPTEGIAPTITPAPTLFPTMTPDGGSQSTLYTPSWRSPDDPNPLASRVLLPRADLWG